jgi:hypothetical protein
VEIQSRGLARRDSTIQTLDRASVKYAPEVSIVLGLLLVVQLVCVKRAIYAEREKLYLTQRKLLRQITTILWEVCKV